MANMSGKSRFPIDAALILRNSGSASLTADTALATQSLVSKGAYWQNPADAKDGVIYLVGKVEAAVDALSIDIYTVEDGGANAKLQASFPVVAGDHFEFPLDEMALLKRHPTASGWYANINLTTSASVFAYLAPDWD